MVGEDGIPICMGSLQVSCEALVKSYDEKNFKLGIGASLKILTFSAELDMEGLSGQSILFEFLQVAEWHLEYVGAINRNKFKSVLTQMEKTATVIRDIIRREFFM